MGTQDFIPDERNAAVLIYVNGNLVPRDQAVVSVFDAGFVLGDGVWEGLRLHKGRFAFLDAHLTRLFDGARAIGLDIGMSRPQLVQALHDTVTANDMTDGVHVRLMVTRGIKMTPNQDPRHTLGGPTIVIVAEHKIPPADAAAKGIALFTATIRCSPPDMFNMQINTHSRLNLITALNQAIAAGADEALMLDPYGFVSSCNSTNFFWVRDGEVRTSTGDYCFAGITRQNIIDICRAEGIALRLGPFALSDTYGADEAFVTGTMGGLAPVRQIDGYTIGTGAYPGPLTRHLRQLYEALVERDGRTT